MVNKLRGARCWLVTEGFSGMENQCLGLAKALDLNFSFKRVNLYFPWKYLPANLCPPSLSILNKGTKSMNPPWPKILISCGRVGAIISRTMKRIIKKEIFSIHIQNPRINLKNFHLLVIPQHDRINGKNLLLSNGAIHHITPRLLKENKKHFCKKFSELPRPIAGVLIGGSSKAYKFDQPSSERLIKKLISLHKNTNCSFVISPSRRTEKWLTESIKDGLGDIPKYIWDKKETNPYIGILSSADAIIVTCESVSMISESCATGKPIYLFEYKGKSKRIKIFHEMMYKKGYAKPLGNSLEKWKYKIPNETEVIASQIKKIFNKVVL